MTQIQRMDLTSAEDKSVGFDYQYYYFLNELLNLKTGMTVGLEVMDDVHTELDNDTQVLIQLKHTVQTNADGSPKNLTTMDVDLWKTLSNWSKVITDPLAARSNIVAQRTFTERTKFLLASNKSYNENNCLLRLIQGYQSQEISYDEIKAEICNIGEKTDSDEIKCYIENVLCLSQDVLSILLTQLRFDLGCDNIIEKCKTGIREHHIADNRVDDVFRALDSDIRSHNFHSVKTKKKITVSFEEFRNSCRPHFDKARNERLTIHRFSGLLPERMVEQVFIQQLVDISDFEPSDTDETVRLTTQLLTARNNLDRWIKDSDITLNEVKELEDELVSAWRNKFKASYRGNIPEAEVIEKARNIVDSLREKMLDIQGQNLGTDFSNGMLSDLSDRPDIGWRNDWKERYI